MGKYVSTVLTSRHLTTGPQVEGLRRELATYCRVDVEQVVLGSSASGLFQAWLDYMERKWFDLAITWEGVSAWPLFWNLVRYRFGAGTAYREGKAVTIHTDIGGAQMPTARHQAEVFHDACHGWTVGKLAQFTLLSFYPTKLCSGAEGGALVCKSADAAREIQVLANCGLSAAGKSPDFNDMDPRGRKANMTDVAACLNREALEGVNIRKRQIELAWYETHAAYLAHGGDDERVLQQTLQPYLFQVMARDVGAARHVAALAGVASQVNFPPAKYVTLPCYGGMTESQRREVVKVAVEISEL